jgi:hypothetical protein
MKSYKEYLTESKRVYEFKVKLGGDLPKDCQQKIKHSLGEFKVESCSAGKGVPTQARHYDFPEHRNISMTIFDVSTAYPATSLQVQDAVAIHLGMPHSLVKVKNLAEEHEYEINHEHAEKTGEAFLNKHEIEYTPGGQDMVGDKRAMTFLKGLGSEPKHLEEYTGVNDKLFPKAGKEKTQAEQPTISAKSSSPIGTQQNKIPHPLGGK